MSLFDDRTFENLQAEMLRDLSTDVDQQEGSLVATAIAKQAVRLEEAYDNLDYVYENQYVDTMDREHLVETGQEAGLPIKEGTAAVVLGVFNCQVPAETLITAIDSEYNYSVGTFAGMVDVESEDEDGEPVTVQYYSYNMTAEEPGVEPGSYVGDVEPIEFLEGFEEGWIDSLVSAGEDEEDTEVYRERRLQWFQTKSCAGNRTYYKTVVEELDGVTAAKANRRSANGSYVDVYILGTQYLPASASVVAAVKDAVDPTSYQGQGYGLAPIGHQVAVYAATSVTVNMVLTLTLQTGVEYTDIKTDVEEALGEYILSLRENWGNEDHLVVRKSAVEMKLLGIEGIEEVGGVTINGSASNLTLTSTQVPTLGTVTKS